MPIAEREFKDSSEVELVTEVHLQDRELNPREQRVEKCTKGDCFTKAEKYSVHRVSTKNRVVYKVICCTLAKKEYLQENKMSMLPELRDKNLENLCKLRIVRVH